MTSGFDPDSLREAMAQMGGTAFMVGQPWPLEPQWVSQRGFRWMADWGILLLVEDDVDQEMRDAIAGPADFAVAATGPLVGVLARFGPLWDWMESFMYRRPGQGVPETLDRDDTGHMLIQVVLADSGTGRIEAMRAATLSPHVTQTLIREARDRWRDGTDAETAAATLQAWEQRYPTTKASLKGTLARCHVGD